MKNKIQLHLLLITAALLISCNQDFLDIKPPASLTEESFFKSEADMEAAITAAYNPLKDGGLYGNNYAKITEAPTDDIIIYNTQGLSLDSWTFANNDAIIDAVWQTCYEGIFRSNVVLQSLSEVEIDQDRKDRIFGEAYFLRALYYWHLTTLFGEVPMIQHADPSDVSTSLIAKSPLAELYAFMVEDLEKASTLLPLQSSYGSSDIGRASKGAAEALLGKVYLYAKNYPKAELHFENVIKSNEYRLLSQFDELLITDNNPESIFEVQFADIINQGTSRIANDYPQGQGGYANLLPTRDLVEEYENYSGGTAINNRDPRLFYSIFREGDPYDEVSPIFKEQWTPTGYAKKKGSFPVIRSNNYNLGRNFPIIRLADVILMYAEAANENGKISEAVQAINEVRGRQSVAMPLLPTVDFPVDSKAEVFKAIVHERRVELAFEHHRLNDVRRWDLGEEVFGSLGYKAPKHKYFPIPQSEIDNNPNLVQNSDY